MSSLRHLPQDLASLSLSKDEIVLPLAEAIRAIDVLTANGISILGWEGWLKYSDGRVGHGNAPQGTASLDGCPLARAATLCKETISQSAGEWEAENNGSENALYFSITVA